MKLFALFPRKQMYCFVTIIFYIYIGWSLSSVLKWEKFWCIYLLPVYPDDYTYDRNVDKGKVLSAKVYYTFSNIIIIIFIVLDRFKSFNLSLCYLFIFVLVIFEIKCQFLYWYICWICRLSDRTENLKTKHKQTGKHNFDGYLVFIFSLSLPASSRSSTLRRPPHCWRCPARRRRGLAAPAEAQLRTWEPPSCRLQT